MNIFSAKLFSIVGIVFCFVVIALGAWTRLEDAGLGCPDWPLCYGEWIFPQTPEAIEAANNRFPDNPVDIAKVIPEVVHRFFAASLGLFAIALLAITIREKKMRTEATILLIVIICQGIFGALTVTLKLHPLIVSTHLFGAMIVASLFLLIYLKSSEIKGPYNALVKNKNYILFGFVLLILQIFLGVWTSTNYASWSCLEFPTCQSGEFLPTTKFSEGFDLFQPIGPNYLYGEMSGEARTAIHLTHRIGAIFILFYSLFLSAKIWSEKTKPIVIFFLSALFLQVLLGISNIMTLVAVWNGVAHNLIAVTLFLTFVVMIYLSFRRGNESS
tara:strand:- start:26845 stop:27831 length:987 start_codon:yes stop_codon:yes gene_type:complete